MSKGSQRRPPTASLSDAELGARWAATFGRAERSEAGVLRTPFYVCEFHGAQQVLCCSWASRVEHDPALWRGVEGRP